MKADCHTFDFKWIIIKDDGNDRDEKKIASIEIEVNKFNNKNILNNQKLMPHTNVRCKFIILNSIIVYQ